MLPLSSHVAVAHLKKHNNDRYHIWRMHGLKRLLFSPNHSNTGQATFIGQEDHACAPYTVSESDKSACSIWSGKLRTLTTSPKRARKRRTIQEGCSLRRFQLGGCPRQQRTEDGAKVCIHLEPGLLQGFPFLLVQFRYHLGPMYPSSPLAVEELGGTKSSCQHVSHVQLSPLE